MSFCIKCLGHFEGTAINLGLAILTKLCVCVCPLFYFLCYLFLELLLIRLDLLVSVGRLSRRGMGDEVRQLKRKVCARFSWTLWALVTWAGTRVGSRGGFHSAGETPSDAYLNSSILTQKLHLSVLLKMYLE